jgi:hypothetical protein
VIAYMSSIHVDPDLAVEFFLLEQVEGAEESDPTPATESTPASQVDGDSPDLDGDRPG